jgi:hypothetical protein
MLALQIALVAVVLFATAMAGIYGFVSFLYSDLVKRHGEGFTFAGVVLIFFGIVGALALESVGFMALGIA